MVRKIFALIPAVAMLLTPVVVFAHVIVTPSQAGVGQELTFNVSVPNERQAAVTNLKLLIPQGVTNVVPTVANGWTIQRASNGSKPNPQVTAITWTDGSIPVGEREDFSFSAQVPGSPTQLDWKAYQTYADGTVVHWDQKPAGSDDSVGTAGPYSVTTVVNDLSSTGTTTKSSTTTLPLVLSLLALILSFASLLFRKKA